MEKITSRKNSVVAHFRILSKEAAARLEQREFVGDGVKLLSEALASGQEVTAVLWKAGRDRLREGFPSLACPQYSAAEEVFDYASPLVSSPGPLFTVKMRPDDEQSAPLNAVVLENVQDPGNVGTVLRTAAAFGIGAVILTGACADRFSPKTVRATMGAIFRQRTLCIPVSDLKERLDGWGLPLYGAVLSQDAKTVTEADLTSCAVAVGNEGNGLTAELIGLCRGSVIIPMEPGSESLNASVAASVLMWEMKRRLL